MISDEKIDIVLATYNGEKYILEQIKSIQNCHRYTDLVARIIIVDDGSTDNTMKIIRSLSETDTKIEIYSFSEKNVGPLKNFSRGIKLTSSPYIMLCDQDDVWLPEKIVKSHQKISNFCSSKPALVYCDLMIVNENLDLLSSSYFCCKKIPKTWDKHFIQLLQQNTVSGCAAIFNRALLEKATPIPDDAYMHDWWLALVAKAFGNLKLIDEPLIKYRQHANNSIGVKKRTLKRIDKQYQYFKSSMMKVEKQAKVFSKSFDVSPQTALGKDLVLISSMSALTPLQKVKLWYQRRLDRSHITGRIILLVYLLFSCK